MKLSPHLKAGLILNNCQSTSTEEILNEIIHHLKIKNKISNEKHILKKLIDREKLGSTSIGNHSAVPHAKLKEIKEPLIAVGISKKGVMYHAEDKEPVHFIILILSPTNSPIVHLQILAAAASLIKKSKKFIKEIIASSTADESIAAIQKYEAFND